MGAPRRLTWRWRLLAAIVILAVRLVRWRIDVRGLEHVPSRGGAVLVFNHHSYVDFIMVAWPIVRERRRPIRFLAKREIWSSRKVGWVTRWAGAVPVDRGSATARAGAFDAAIGALVDGDLVAVAPEQTIPPSLELLPFRTGAARMAQGAQVPIIPVVGWGSQRFATKGARPRLVTGIPVTVRFGEPIVVGPDDDPGAVTATLRERMAAMLTEEQQRYPDGLPAGAPWVPARLGGGAPSHAAVLAEHEARTGRWEHRRGSGPTGGPASGA
jgi:1-acyl-sn-glycerol-3-phosphate acyltransferase